MSATSPALVMTADDCCRRSGGGVAGIGEELPPLASRSALSLSNEAKHRRFRPDFEIIGQSSPRRRRGTERNRA